jgi:hypothetical protein
MAGDGTKLLAELSDDELDAIVRFLRLATDLNERHAVRVRRLAAERASEPPAA